MPAVAMSLRQKHFSKKSERRCQTFFLLDYAAVMGLFVFIGHYLAEILKRYNRKGKLVWSGKISGF